MRSTLKEVPGVWYGSAGASLWDTMLFMCMRTLEDVELPDTINVVIQQSQLPSIVKVRAKEFIVGGSESVHPTLFQLPVGSSDDDVTEVEEV